MDHLVTPADGIRAFDLTPMVFREIAQWTKRHGARVISRRVIHGVLPSVLVAYVIDRQTKVAGT